MNRLALGILVVAALLGSAAADLYMHSPPGSNNRNRERNDNRNNGNRLFDSQNNGNGGYAWRGSARKEASLDYDDIPDPLVYYAGSILRVEWTNQHACGPNPNIHCQLVMQYACHNPDPDVEYNSKDWIQGLRDGYPTGGEVESDNTYAGYIRREFAGNAIPGTGTTQNDDGTNTIPTTAFQDSPEEKREFYYEGKGGGMEFGMHEGIEYYENCKGTIRNKGLYTSDQNVNQHDATRTRQNPGGTRRGLECPEERDYYPYWRPAPWRDIAVLTSNTSWCEYYKDNSQNVVEVGYCDCDTTCKQKTERNLIPITNATCTTAGGEWKMRAPLGGDAPECLYHSWGRDNHLGNTAPLDEDGNLLSETYQPETAFYNWKIPEEAVGKHCVLRMRYNISTDDYDTHSHASPELEERKVTSDDWSCKNMVNRGQNQEQAIRIAKGLPTEEDIAEYQAKDMLHCVGILNGTVRPVFERPYVALFPKLVDVEGAPKQLAVAINTDQTSRTFQDRSHVFKVANRPSGFGGKIFNLGVRGRRGNIVQAYPSVEYDFTPSMLQVSADDWVHIQIHGSDFNAAKNANNGEGWRYSDRHNIIQTKGAGDNYPLPLDEVSMFDEDKAEFFAMLEQTDCGIYYYNKNDNDRTTTQNQRNNCAQLNKAPNRFPLDPADGMVRFREGHYYYTSTRNNNFSNRSHKAQLIVGEGEPEGLSTGETAAVAIGSIAAAGVLVGGVLLYGKKKPDSTVGSCFRSTANFVTCQSTSAAASTSVAAPSMDYTRH